MEKEPQKNRLKSVPQVEQLRSRIEQQARRMRQAEKRRPGLFRQTIYLGTLGLLFVLPPVAGAYLGHWLDSLASGYSIRWTVSLIVVGVFCGALNVYLFVKE